jgi:TetR/AcrR family transcriptional repressor of mexCD-oprJ operon
MAAQRATSYQREVASRNVEAILDAVEELLQSQGQANISAVAAQAGVSRVTVYAHFPDWAALLEAAVERAVRRTMAALQAVHPEDGPPAEALDRMLAATWQHLARYRAMAAAVAELLSPEAVTRTHQAAHHTIGALLARGQADGSFRTDLPAGWLVTASIALVHACSDGVRAGHIEEHDAAGILTTSVRDLLTGTRPRTEPAMRNAELANSQDHAGLATAQQPDIDPQDPARGAPASDRLRRGRQ